MNIFDIKGRLGIVELTVYNHGEKEKYKKLLYGPDDWFDLHYTSVSSSITTILEKLYRENLFIPVAAGMLDINKDAIKGWCERGRITAEYTDKRLRCMCGWVVDHTEIKRIIEIYKKSGDLTASVKKGPKRLFSIEETAEFIGVDRSTLHKYLNEGVPVSFLDEGSLERILDTGTFEYNEGEKALKIKTYRLAEKGRRYLDEETVEALADLNKGKVNGWLSVSEYVRATTEDLNATDLKKAVNYVDSLCRNNGIRYSVGLGGTFYLPPIYADRETLESRIEGMILSFLGSYKRPKSSRVREVHGILDDCLDRRYRRKRANKKYEEKIAFKEEVERTEVNPDESYALVYFKNDSVELCIPASQAAQIIGVQASTISKWAERNLAHLKSNGILFIPRTTIQNIGRIHRITAICEQEGVSESALSNWRKKGELELPQDPLGNHYFNDGAIERLRRLMKDKEYK